MTRINTNVSSLVAQNRLNKTNSDLQTSLTRLSTGLRINSGKDDPAGLIASEALRSDITSINKAISNTQRASQIIATADSALGQVSTLLNDIRGLVVEAANNGALSDDEIAANQLQVDSSLAAINRIAQTTTFQGRKLLDGSLDFITTAGTNFTSISNLRINQANLGQAGSVALGVEITSAATRARVNVTNIPAAGANGQGQLALNNLSAANEATATVTGAVSSAAFAVTAKNGTAIDGTAGNGIQVVLANGTTAATAQAQSGLYTFDTSGGDFAIAAKQGGAYDGGLGNAVTVNIVAGNTATAQASASGFDVNGVTDAFSITAKSFEESGTGTGNYSGELGNALDIEVVLGTPTAGVASAAIAGNTLTITVDNTAGSVTLADIAAALEADNGAGGFDENFKIDIGDNANVLFRTGTTNDATTANVALSGGTNVNARAELDISTPASPVLTITLNEDEAGTISFDDLIADLTADANFDEFEINVGQDGSIDITNDTAINTGDGLLTGGDNASATGSYANGVLSVTVNNQGSESAADVIAALAADTALDALFTFSGASGSFATTGDNVTATLANGTDLNVTNSLAITGPSGEINNGTLTVQTSATVTTPEVDVDEDGNFTIRVSSTANTTLADIKTAIDAQTGYSATISGTGDSTFNPTTDTFTTVSNITGATDGGITHDVVFELGGKKGSQVFEISAGTTLNQLIDQINLVSEATGVTASVDDTDNLLLRSVEYGQTSYVDLRIIDEDSSGTFTSAVGVRSRDEGSDVVAKVNGVDASGDGNTLKVKTATLDLDLTLDAGFSGNIGFTITGGGAKFQLGPEVVTNQQARIGIGSVNTARLGGSTGKLYQLAEGGSAALKDNPNLAAEIVDEAIGQVTSLRGRLGAFQATTLESNLVSLNDTVANLQEAESSIRDADFASESARLTRAQILVQSGTSVLGIANQNPQNVLGLLR
jgi:flagellin